MVAFIVGVALDLKISPGHQIGKIKIGDTLEQVEQRLGKSDPKLGDAAMGHFWTGYKSGKFLLTIYSVRGTEDKAHVKIIHVNSPSFKQANHIHVGSSWQSIHRAYPSLDKVPNITGKVAVWDQPSKGIAFDISNGKCVGIAVHKLGESIGSQYLSYFGNSISN